MSTRRREPADASLPSPFPEGWYFVASRQAVLKAKLIQKTWMGENIVVWCDENGRVCVAEAVCPHLGSDLGPAAGGRISWQVLARCSMHWRHWVEPSASRVGADGCGPTCDIHRLRPSTA